MGLCITNIVPAKHSDVEEAPGLCPLCCSQSYIKWCKRRLENLSLLPYVICVSQSTDSYSLQGCHRSPGPVLHLLLAPATTGTCQPRRKETTLDKVCLCKGRSLFPGVSALHCPVNMSCPHKKAALLFSWSLSQHIGCNSLLCFCSLILNRWCDPLDFTRYNFCHSMMGLWTMWSSAPLELNGLTGSTQMHFKWHSWIRVMNKEEEKESCQGEKCNCVQDI